MPESLRALLDLVVNATNPTENAPKWGAAIAVLVGQVLAQADLGVDDRAVTALGVFLGVLIGKAVQRWFTLTRRTSPRAARGRARREDRGVRFEDPKAAGRV